MKIWNVPISWRMRVTNMTPRSCGSVTCQTLQQDPGAVDLGGLIELASARCGSTAR